MNLDSELSKALARKSPSADFSAKVMSRVAAGAPAPRRVARWRAVAAGVVLTAVAGGWAAQRAIERREGERARDEVLLALRITSAKVHTAQDHVRDLGSR